jgi:Ca-activated chloride channel family protein
MRPELVRTVRQWIAGIVTATSLALVPALPPTELAPKHGAVAGRVTDQAGAPIPSAQVRLEGTGYAAVTDSKGQYRISRIARGTYDVTATFVGFKRTMAKGLRVMPGRTVTQHFQLEASAVDIGDIEVVAASNALSPREEVVTKQGMEGASVTTRGGRDDGSATYIDGVPVSPGGRGATFGNAPAPVAPPVLAAPAPAPMPAPMQPPSGLAALTPGWRSGNPGEEYKQINENPFVDPSTTPLSTFSIDVDAASYSNTRRFLRNRQRPPADAVRIEEFVNYFQYAYRQPIGQHPLSVTMEEGACPWAPGHRLILVGLQARQLDRAEAPASNLVFLIDVSGSMANQDKLPLVKRSLQLLVDQLRPQDRVAIVVYAGNAGLVLPSTPGSNREAILESLNRLEAGGSTAGGQGIQLAYAIARENFIAHGNNRVILATDGDFNVGVSSESELVHLIEGERDQGVFLTVLGFGTGNLKDGRMEQLADKGNGQYAYIDGLREARKMFTHELSGTLFAVAKDVKLQLEFNPERVARYRLIGYENRVMAKEDFSNDRKDAGEMGAGHSVTALYEIVPAGAVASGGEEPLRYQPVAMKERGGYVNEWLTAKVRYKGPQENRSVLLIERLVAGKQAPATETFRFASAVAEFGLLLRNSEHRGNASAASVMERAQGALGDDRDGYRAEFIDLVSRWQEIGGERRAGYRE